MQSKADFVRFLWRLLVAAVVVYVIGGIILVFMDDVIDPFGGPSTFLEVVSDLSAVAFRVGAGSLALMAGLWLSTRPWDEG
jgi:uncharacterized membrane protein